MNKPQLSAEMEKRFDEEFCLAVGGGLVYKGELPNGGWMDTLVKHFLATALEEQRKKYLLAIEMLSETFEVESDGELLEVRKGVFDFKEEVLAILNGEE